MDLYYIEEGYYDAGYYVYTAVAASTINSAFSQSCDAEKITSGVTVNATGSFNSEGTSSFQATKIANGVADFTASFTQSSTISHIHGSDLFAFSDAAIAVQVDRIRDNNIAATSVFNIATSVERIQQGDADADAIFSAIINGLRSRDVNLDAQAAFSFDCVGDKVKLFDITLNVETSVVCDATKITPFIQCEASVASEFAVQADCGKILQYQSAISSTVTLTATISHIEGADLFAFSQSTLSASAERTRDTQANISDAFSTQATAIRIQSLEAAVISSSDVSTTVIRNRFSSADLQSQSDVAGSADKIKNAQADFTSQSTVSALVGNIKQYASSQTTQVSVDAIVYKIIQSASSTTSATTLVAFSSVARGSTIIAFNFASLNVLPFVSVTASSNLVSQASTQIIIAKISGNAATISSESSVNANTQRLRDNQSSCSSVSSLSIDNARIRYSQSSLASVATLNAVIGRQQSIDLYAFSNNSLTADVAVVRSAQSDSQLQFTTNKSYAEDGYVEDEYATNFLTIANYIVDNLQQLSSVSVMLVNGELDVQGAALLANSGTMTTTAVKITVASSSQLFNANTNIDVAKTVNITLSVQSAFTVFANGGRQDEVSLTAFTNAALVATARKVVSPSSNNNAVSTLFADTADSLSIRGQATLSSAFTSSLAISKIAGFGANLQASGFTVTVGTASTDQGASLSCVFSVGATARVIRNGVVNAAVVSSASIQITRARTTSAAIASAMTFVVAVRELRLDAIVYVIPAEGWTYRIEGETRLHTILSESRVKEIVGESRLHTINGESRIHII
jgi:hypothetical protein